MGVLKTLMKINNFYGEILIDKVLIKDNNCFFTKTEFHYNESIDYIIHEIYHYCFFHYSVDRNTLIDIAMDLVVHQYSNPINNLTLDYFYNRYKLKYKCPGGHLHQIGFSEWKKGQRCPYCAIDKLKLHYEDVKAVIEAEGYTLISKEYVNKRTDLDMVCHAGHTTSMTFSNWQCGFRCKHCARNVRFTIDFVRAKFKEFGYTLLSTEYVNQKQKLIYKCPYGHEHTITFTDWYNGGYRCPTCYAIKMSGAGNHGWQGGVSNGDYCPVWKDKEYKQDIRDRDGNCCLNQ